VFKLPVESVYGGEFAPFLWAFIEADEDSGVPKSLVCNGTNLYIIFPTSPKRPRWKLLTQLTAFAEIIMNPWSLEEMHQA